MHFALVLTNVASVDGTWTSMHLGAAILRAGHQLSILEPPDFEVTEAHHLVARVWAADAEPKSVADLARAVSQHRLPRRYVTIRQIDRLLMRVNPLSPSASQFCLLAKESGVMVVNDPAGVARTRAKAWLATLPADVPRPRTLVTGSRATASKFLESVDGPIIVKPASGSGGRDVSLIPRGKRAVLDQSLARLGARGATHAVLQEYIPEAKDGEKRLVWVDGELLGAYRRISAEGDFRHNLKQGALPTPTTIEPSDERISQSLSPHLIRNGIRIAGLDVIGDRLVEVNTLNPGGVHWADALGGRRAGWIADETIARLQRNPPPAMERKKP